MVKMECERELSLFMAVSPTFLLLEPCCMRRSISPMLFTMKQVRSFTKNKPRINEDPKDALLKQYEEEIKALKALLEQAQTGGGSVQASKVDLRMMRMPTQEHLRLGGEDETVDSLLEKLARKGKKVKLIDESAAEEGDVQGGRQDQRQADEDDNEIEEDININNDPEVAKRTGGLAAVNKSKSRTVAKGASDSAQG